MSAAARFAYAAREVHAAKAAGALAERPTRRARPGAFELRPLRFDDPLVRDALAPLDVALLALLVAYQRHHGRPTEDGTAGGVTVSLARLASDRHVRAKVGRTPTERQVRASLERLRRYGLERVVGTRYVPTHTDAAELLRVTVREALPGVDVPDDAPVVVVPHLARAHEQAAADKARPGRGGRRWSPSISGQTRDASGRWSTSPRAAEPSNVALASVKRGSCSTSAHYESNPAPRSGPPSNVAPYLLYVNWTEKVSEDGDTALRADRFSGRKAPDPPPNPTAPEPPTRNADLHARDAEPDAARRYWSDRARRRTAT